jgi:hypothetical protein
MRISMKITALVLGLTLAGSAFACTQNGKRGIVPENKLKIPAGKKSINGITESDFNAAIDEVETVFAPIVANYGGKLKIERNWTDGTVNAYANQQGKTWTVAMFGGLARHPAVTRDAMALVVCHELGHHIGGAPKIRGAGNRWASNEGQADYFAALKCLRRAWINDNNESIAKSLNAPKLVVDGCKKTYKSDRVENALCIRTSMAGKSVADLFSDLEGAKESKFETPDTTVVTRTDDNHPRSQCRLDTYYQGSLCEVAFTEDVSQTEEAPGTCHKVNGHKIGLRPLCWFKPSAK